MTKEIKTHLKGLAKEKNIKILLAIESGSRAWGFPSPDSDYDVRIIYIHSKAYYLSITEQEDNIDYFHGELLDINGWDIRKTLRLLSQSNATPFEWNQSPIVYHAETGFQEKLHTLASNFFQPRHSLNHYKGIALNSFKALAENDTIRLKKLFYVLRPLLAAHWIIEKESIPPMNIFELMAALKNDRIVKQIHQLVQLKEGVNEDYVHTVSPEILTFIHQQIERLEAKEYFEKSKRKDIEPLNIFFRSLFDDIEA